jgi:AhpD family alkylhydroperoxidase
MNRLLIPAMSRTSLAQIRHVRPVPPHTADKLVARVRDQMQRDFGLLAPPVWLHSPAPPVLAACWIVLRETLLTGGLVDRAAKESVASAVSAANSCPYCVDVHSATLRALAGGREPTGRVRDLAAWVRNGPPYGDPPFPPEEAPEVIAVAVAFHYINRMVHVFLPESPFPPALPASARGGARWMFGRLMRPAALRVAAAGESLDLLPAAPLPEDLSWAAGRPEIGQAYARMVAAVDEAGTRAVPASVRKLVLDRLAGWDGRPPGLSRCWVDEAVRELPLTDRPAGRLSLLTAFASSQVDQSAVDEFRSHRPADADLIGLCAWAGLAAARWVGGRLSAACTRSAGTPGAATGGDR